MQTLEITPVGKVTVTAQVENLKDLWKVEEGLMPLDGARRVDVADALVDTGATFLSLPASLVADLGLEQYATRSARTTAGVRDVTIYETVRLSVQGRECHVDVAEIPDGFPVLIGQIPLEQLDFVVDPIGQQLIGNPDHGGVQMLELF